MRVVLAAISMSIIVAAAPVAAQTASRDRTTTPKPTRPGTLTAEMVVAVRGVGDVQMSPDGKRIAYVVSVPRARDDSPGQSYQEIWIADADGRAPARRFTPVKQRAWAPGFSPDGRSLGFLSTRLAPTDAKDAPETTDLYVLDLDGGEARLVTDGKLSVAAFRWAPSGKTIAFAAKDLETDTEKADKKAGRDFEVVDRSPKPQRLWAVDLATGGVRQVTTGDANVLGFDWSPDGERLVLRVTDTPRVDDDYMYSWLALVPASGGAPSRLVHSQGKLGNPVFSPRGTQVAWLGATDINDPFAGSVFVVPVGGGQAVDLTARLDGDATWVDWLDEETLVAAVTRGTRTELELLGRRGGKSRLLRDDGTIFTEASLSRDGARVALAGSTPLQPNEVYAGSLSRGSARWKQLTQTNPGLDQVQLGQQDVVRWKAPDGLQVEGVLVRPLGFVAGQRYPLVVIVHGGPESCYRNGWITSWGNWTQLLASNGYMVLLPNYRGSIGRGNDYERADHGDLGGHEFEDVVAGIDHLAQQGWVDAQRVGIGGGSYGGYFSAWAATAYSERFAAAVDFAGITNWISMQGTSDIPEENALVHWNLPFYDNMEMYWKRSPLAHVQKCRTPLLLAHGDKDARVPPGQATEMYTALRLLGREVEYVRYPREAHGLREAPHQLDYLTRSLAWFDAHLKNGQPGVTRR